MEYNNQEKNQIAKVMRENIPQSNLIVANTLLMMAVVSFAMLIIFRIGFLKANGMLINISLVTTPILFIISGVWCIIKKGKGRFFQYAFLALLAIFWLELELMSGYKTKMLLPILIVLSLRYYNRKFTVFTYVVCVLVMLASVFCNAYLYDVTGFIDLNLVSLDESYNISFDLSFDGFIVKSIIALRPSPEMLIKNGLLITFLPNMLFLSFTTALAIRFMRYNLSNIVKTEEIALREANQRADLADMKTKVMLSQIKPHFIYNTLTTISYFCNTEPAKADELTNRFSEYLRSNLSSLSETETVDFTKELDAIRNYLEIEKMRFDDRINVVYDIRCDSFSIPVLSIQPIVENAVKHGICKKEDGGTVTISSYEEEDCYCITVKDDGVGFDKNGVNFDGKEHVGVKNIMSRIESYGGKISIESEVGIGTTVTVRLPKEGKLC